MRPEGPAPKPKGQESLAQGLAGINVSPTYLSAPSGLLGWGELPRVNPGLCFLGHFGPRIGNVQTPCSHKNGLRKNRVPRAANRQRREKK